MVLRMVPLNSQLPVLINQPAFYHAFDIKEGDAMYHGPDQRVTIW